MGKKVDVNWISSLLPDETEFGANFGCAEHCAGQRPQTASGTSLNDHRGPVGARHWCLDYGNVDFKKVEKSAVRPHGILHRDGGVVIATENVVAGEAAE